MTEQSAAQSASEKTPYASPRPLSTERVRLAVESIAHACRERHTSVSHNPCNDCYATMSLLDRVAENPPSQTEHGADSLASGDPS